MNKLALVVAFSFSTGCASMIARTDPASLQKYDEMSQCARDAQVNPVRANCGERFKDVVISGEFEQLRLDSHGTYVLLRPRTDGSHMSCWLDGPQDKAQLAALAPRDRVTIKGSLQGRTVLPNTAGGADWATLELHPCELVAASKN